MLNNKQIKLVQMAVRAAGIRSKHADGQYRLLLAQYKQSDGRPVNSCKQLNNWELEDLLAICESQGWQCPGKEPGHFRRKVAGSQVTGRYASFAQQSAIQKLAGDLGWADYQLAGMVKRMTKGAKTNIASLSAAEAYRIIEALKAMFSRERGKRLNTLKDVEREVTDGEDTSRKVG